MTLVTYRSAFKKFIRQIKVVHHLPGRLRLYIPLLEGLSPEWRRYQTDVIEIIKLKRGLLDIELSTISGRVLICYDPRRTGKTGILEWLEKVALMLYANYVDAPFKSKQQIGPFLKRARSKICQLPLRNSHVREVV